MKLKPIRKERDETGRAIIVCERNFLVFKKEYRYLAEARIAGDYYTWVRLPGYEIVPDYLSFQLDVWNRNME